MKEFKYSLLFSIVAQIIIWTIFIFQQEVIKANITLGGFVVYLMVFTLLYFLITNIFVKNKKINSNNFNIWVLVLSVPLSILFMILCIEISNIINPPTYNPMFGYGLDGLRHVFLLFCVISIVDIASLLRIFYDFIHKTSEKQSKTKK